jgi:hypothetical protein
VLVPGVPGYVPVRDRALLTWTRGDGSESPEWWEIGQEDKKQQIESDEAILPEISPGEPNTFVRPLRPLTGRCILPISVGIQRR